MKTTPESAAAALSPLLSTVDVLQILGVSRPTLRRMEKRGEFPKAITLGTVKRWKRADITAFLDQPRSA